MSLENVPSPADSAAPATPPDAAPPDSAPDAPANAAAPAAAPVGQSLPLPFSAIAAGKLPGLQIPPIHKNDGVPNELQHYVIQNLHVLMQSGMDYKDLPNHTTVVFNPDVVTPEKIEAAYKDGTLDKVVPTAKAFAEFVQKKQAEAAAPANVPVPAAPAPGTALASVPPPAPPAPVGGKDITPPGVTRARLAGIVPPKGIVLSPVPKELAKRAL